MGEHFLDMEEVVGSLPTRTTQAFVAQQVEQLPCKEKVAGSIPVKGSIMDGD